MTASWYEEPDVVHGEVVLHGRQVSLGLGPLLAPIIPYRVVVGDGKVKACVPRLGDPLCRSVR